MKYAFATDPREIAMSAAGMSQALPNSADRRGRVPGCRGRQRRASQAQGHKYYPARRRRAVPRLMPDSWKLRIAAPIRSARKSANH